MHVFPNRSSKISRIFGRSVPTKYEKLARRPPFRRALGPFLQNIPDVLETIFLRNLGSQVTQVLSAHYKGRLDVAFFGVGMNGNYEH